MNPRKLNGRQNHPITLTARVEGLSAANITQASISSIAYRVWEYDTEAEYATDTEGTEVGVSAALTVASVVFDTLQTDYDWEVTTANPGYNFRFTLPKARLPNKNKWYRVDAMMTPASGEAFLGGSWAINTTPLPSA